MVEEELPAIYDINEQVAQLSQRNRAAGWVMLGRNIKSFLNVSFSLFLAY